ncbi:hypothetical protein PPACK8108_LOCUS20169 [Phakopsora pachyrhizi]|uniref:Uncharacterized protein n=1 Tax=Phakopsora pachyrhizi TaxID=170000 RepID=A0AAV0BEM6_PHAPC|nr:hypothetical protein PPACK8108_LOCUS20169 [Phakopsora pachyrhizi]
MIYFKFPKILPCLALWVKYNQGSEEAIDFLANFAGQTKASSGVYNVFDPIAQPETLEKSWLSLGTSKSEVDSDAKRLKMATESSEYSVRVLGMSSNLGIKEIIRQPVHQIPQPSRHARSKASAMAATQFSAQSSKPNDAHWNYMHNPELLIEHSLHYQPSINLFKPLNTIHTSTNKARVPEANQSHITEKNIEQDLISDPSKKKFEKKKTNTDQTIQSKSFEETCKKRKIKYPNKRKKDMQVEITINPEQKAKFQNKLMELLEPKNSMIKLDFVQGCIDSIQKAKDNYLRDSMLVNLDCIMRQISKHGGSEFYITNSEVHDFFRKSSDISYKIKSNSILLPNSKAIRYQFLTDFKGMIETMDFRNLVKKFIKVDELKQCSAFKIEDWQALDRENKSNFKRLWKKMYIGKVFLVYSIIINKIFCYGSKNDGFMKRQRAAIELYSLVLISFDRNNNKTYVL